MTFNEMYNINYVWTARTVLTIIYDTAETMSAREARRRYGDYIVDYINGDEVSISDQRRNNITFSDLYFANNDWEKSTILEITTISANKRERLKAYKTLMMYAGYEVVGFSLNSVALRAPVCLSQNKEEKAK